MNLFNEWKWQQVPDASNECKSDYYEYEYDRMFGEKKRELDWKHGKCWGMASIATSPDTELQRPTTFLLAIPSR